LAIRKRYRAILDLQSSQVNSVFGYISRDVKNLMTLGCCNRHKCWVQLVGW